VLERERSHVSIWHEIGVQAGQGEKLVQRKWFADIGHNEINPETLARLSLFWFSEYTAVQNSLEAAITRRATA
jgi:hypothetical protein